MTNKELQQRTEKIIKSLGTTHEWMQGKKIVDSEWVEIKNQFPIGRKYAYNISRGKFDQCGKHGIAAMEKHFNKLDN